MTSDPIQWTRDLDDDCLTSWNGLEAHVERMEDPLPGDCRGIWSCHVWRWGKADKAIFATSEHFIRPQTGEAARTLAETIMRLTHAGHDCAADFDRIGNGALSL